MFYHIKRVKSKYKDYVKMLKAIFDAKYWDFMKLGATHDEALNCLDQWINSEAS